VQHRGVVAVAVADLDRVQPVPFQGQTVGRARLGNHARVRNLTGEQLVPARLAWAGGRGVHESDRALGGVNRYAGEAFGQQRYAEPVIAVAMSDVDVGQPLAGAFDPVTDPLGLLDGERWVNQNCIGGTGDKGRRDRRPLQRCPGGERACGGDLRGHEYVI
jgi:hypothetical protein